MQKEEWINEVLNSTKGIQKAEAPVFLFEKIANAIETNKQRETKPLVKWAFACLTIIFIGINIVSIKKINSFEETKNVSEQMSEFNQAVIYTY